MIEPIAEMLRVYIQTLNFAERVYGVVRPVKFQIRTPDSERPIVKIVPFARNDFEDDCSPGELEPAIPDSRYMSTHFFEDGGIVMADQDSFYYHCEASLRLVSWYNLRRINLDFENCNLMTANILHVIPPRLPNNGYYSAICVEAESEDVKGVSVFGNYTMDDKEKQYANYPFDCAAINFLVKYWMPINCVEAITLNPASC